MSYRRVLLLTSAACLALSATAPAATVEINASDAMPAAPVPIVPLPPAIFGAAASVGIAAVLRFTRHRRWVTLR